MAKYNIVPKKEKVTTRSYRNSVTPSVVEDISKKIIMKLMIEQKYRDPKYSARRLANDIGANMRHLSAVINMRFQLNYAQLVGEMRIHEAKYMLQDSHFVDMTMEDIAINVGFTNRQSFYAAFYRLCGITPREYKLAHMIIEPDAEDE
ncbi:MAG: AraC family transcriptional regulator [Bacteroidaceae bacterium]|nr:AraC family transcriptional regulator [Bacteroidaceae bacterium]